MLGAAPALVSVSDLGFAFAGFGLLKASGMAGTTLPCDGRLRPLGWEVEPLVPLFGGMAR